MPVLPPGPVMYPEDLFAAAEDAAQAPGTPPGEWWVLHTHPRAEKAIARKLHDARESFFLPVAPSSTVSARAGRTGLMPLFPGYLFLRGTREARLAALQTRQVVQCLQVADQARLRADLHAVHRLMQSRLALTPEPSLRPGMEVLVTRGPLQGLRGTVLPGSGKSRVRVAVDFLQRGVSVEVDPQSIRVLGRGEHPATRERHAAV